MTEQSINILDHVRRAVNGRTQRVERSEVGQFLTPVAIARFMALLFAANRLDRIRILDAGEGAGVLWVGRLAFLASDIGV